MNDEHLATYLNDHLAGSVTAVELLENCRDADPNTPLGAEVSALLPEIAEDQAVLRDLIARISSKESTAKTAAAWLAEKLGRVKLGGGSDAASAAFGQMEQLEIVLVGVRGKLALWDVLSAVRGEDVRFAGVDWEALKRRAREQGERIDRRRIALGAVAFKSAG